MPPDAVLRTLDHLWALIDQLPGSVAVAGGIALSYWGNPRSTQDVDLAMLTRDAERACEALEEAGLRLKSREPKDLGIFTLRQFDFEPADQYVHVEVDLMTASSDYYVAAFERTVPVVLPGVKSPISVLSREDLVLHKLYAGRLIDQADVATLMEMHWDALDHEYIRNWSDYLGTTAAWEQAKARRHEEMS